MDKKPDRLTTAFIKSIDRPTRQGDGLGGNGLSILAYYNADGGLNLAWSQRILIDTKLRTFGLGRWPQITITVARKRAFEHIRKRDLGEDIRKTKQTVPTLGEAFDSTHWLTIAPNGKGEASGDIKESLEDGNTPNNIASPYSRKRSPTSHTTTYYT